VLGYSQKETATNAKKRGGNLMKMMEKMWKELSAAFGISTVSQSKRMYFTLPGLHMTVQYGDNRSRYDGLTMEQLNDHLIFVDYQLALLEDLDPQEETPRNRNALRDRQEELEEQFDEILAAMERLERSAKQYRKYCVCAG
jgi:hypothetical protein